MRAVYMEEVKRKVLKGCTHSVFHFILTAKLSSFLPLMLRALVVCGEMIPTSVSSSLLGLFSCWNMGVWPVLLAWPAAVQKSALVLPRGSFHFPCRNDPYQCKDQRSSWFCVTGHVEDTLCFCGGVVTLILKVSQFSKSKNGWKPMDLSLYI